MCVLNLVDNSKTKHEVINGVHWWSNPELSVKINSLGEVHSVKGKKLGGSKPKPTYAATYSVFIKQGVDKVKTTVTFQSLFCYLVLSILSNSNIRVTLKETSKGYTKDNVLVVKINMVQTGETVIFGDDLNSEQSTTFDETPKFYKVTQGETSYITEDGAKFPTKELAEWHQDKVTKGKSNAQIALDYNGGYVMAEQLFLNEVVYNCAKPYEHFKNVLENNDGVREVVGEGDYELYFDKCKVVVANNILRLNWDADFNCTKEEALIAEKLLTTIDDKFMDMLKEVNKFKALFPNLIRKDNI